MKRLSVISGLMLCLLCPILFASDVENYPNKPVQMVISWDSGASSDQIGRLIARLAEPYLGAKIQIINKPGGGGALGFSYIKNAKPDGYVIGIGTTNLASHKIYGNLPFDHTEMETPIIFHSDPYLFCVGSTTPYRSLKEFVEEARRHPGKLSVATGPPGAALYVAIKDFLEQANIDIRIVPCSGSGAQAPILAGGGHVDASFNSALEAQAQIEAGNIRPLALYTAERHGEMPDIPTFAEEGYIQKIVTFRGIITPKGVPYEILKKIHDAFKKAMDEPAFREYVRNSKTTIEYADLTEAQSLYDSQRDAFAAVANQE